VAALAQNNEAGLDGIRAMQYLFRRMAYDDIRFEFDTLFPGAFADGDKAGLESLSPSIEDRMELRALGGFGRPDHSQDEELGFHISRHRQGDIQGVLGVGRRIECNEYPLKSNKDRASHGGHLYLFRGGLPLDCLIRLLACERVGKEMPGQKERVGNHGWNDGAGDDRTHDVRILLLVDDLMIQAEERGDGAEGEAGGHHQRVVGPGIAFVDAHGPPDRRR